jgi:O-antigen/teichoic acid export membrane protein
MGMQRAAAIAAQFSQAAVSLTVALVVLRVLDLRDYGQFTLVVTTVVVLTALVTGLVGDALTVLDRADRDVRYTLQALGVVASLGGAVLAAGTGAALGWFSASEALAVALYCLFFLLEEIGRRLLMASQLFHRVLLVDGIGAAVAIGGMAVLATAELLDLATVFFAMAAGQAVGLLVALVVLPPAERIWIRRAGLRFSDVLHVGAPRAALQLVGPGRLWGAKLLIGVFAGLPAVAAFEANRLLAAPLLLAVQGNGAFLLVSYSARARTGVLPRRTPDSDAMRQGLVVAVLAVPLALLSGPFGPALLGDRSVVDPLLVAGWGALGVSMAVSLPYVTAGTVHGRGPALLAVRGSDAGLGLGLVTALLVLGDAAQTYRWVPWVLGATVLVTLPLLRRAARPVDHVVLSERLAGVGLVPPQREEHRKHDPVRG